jgi:hypothetical protein
MTIQSWFVAAATLLLSLSTVASAVGAQPGPAKSFPVARVRFEQNATDKDVEVVFEITVRSEGLSKLAVVSPDGRTVVDFKAPDSASGIRQFVFESPEPRDIESLKADFPEGTYSFTGVTVSGAALQGKATLNHELPATASFVSPIANATNVPVKDVKISWSAVPEMSGYIIELEQEESDTSIKATLPASVNSFAVPAGFLRPGAEYMLGIGTVSQDGNISYVETSFTTAGND